MGRKKPNFYAVSKGQDMFNDLEHGLFTNWNDCSLHVSGVKGAIFQGCQSFDEAVDILTFSKLAPILVYVNGEWITEQKYRSTALSNGVPNEIMYSEPSDPEYDGDLDDNIDTDNIDTDYYDCDEDDLDKTCITNSVIETSQIECVDLTSECRTAPGCETNETVHHQEEIPQYAPSIQQTDTDETAVKQVFQKELPSDLKTPIESSMHSLGAETVVKKKIKCESTTGSSFCSVCSDPNNDHMLKCNTCTFKVHFHCSGLPNYEIVKYLGHKARKYVCEKCTIVVPKYRNLLGDSEISSSSRKSSVSPGVQLSLQQDLQHESLVDSIKSVVTKELKLFQSSVLEKFESKFVNAVECVMKDSSKVTDELHNINSKVTDANNNIQNLKKSYEQSSSVLKSVSKGLTVESNSSTLTDTKLRSENSSLKDQLSSLRHDQMMCEENLKAKYDSKIETLRIVIEGKDKEINHLKGDINFKSSTIDKLFVEKESLSDKLKESERALNVANDEILSLKVHIAGISKDENGQSISDWSSVPAKEKKQKPSIMLIGTSNIKDIDPERLSSNFNTEKHIAYTFAEAEKVIKGVTNKPDAVAFHVLTNELKSNSSIECVSKLQNLIKLTEEKMPSTKILISQATNRSDDQNLNLKVNTINSLINELGNEDSSKFSICDNTSIGLNGQVKDKFIRDDGYHLSVDGVKVLASNIRKSLERVLSIQSSNNGQRNLPYRKKWPKRNRNNLRRD